MVLTSTLTTGHSRAIIGVRQGSRAAHKIARVQLLVKWKRKQPPRIPLTLSAGPKVKPPTPRNAWVSPPTKYNAAKQIQTETNQFEVASNACCVCFATNSPWTCSTSLEDQVVDEVPALVVREGEDRLAVRWELVQALVLDDFHGLLHSLGQLAASEKSKISRTSYAGTNDERVIQMSEGLSWEGRKGRRLTLGGPGSRWGDRAQCPRRRQPGGCP